jgi:hypothetical protein
VYKVTGQLTLILGSFRLSIKSSMVRSLNERIKPRKGGNTPIGQSGSQPEFDTSTTQSV